LAAGEGAVQLFEVEARDRLRLVVFGHREVVARQIADDRAALVAHDDVDQHELGAGAEHGALLRVRPHGRMPATSAVATSERQAREDRKEKNRSTSSEPESRQDLNAPHRPYGRHTAERRRVHVRVDRRELHIVEQSCWPAPGSTARASDPR
jgi:hypothetical protein